MYLCGFRGMHMQKHTCKDQRAICGTLFFSPALYVWETKLRLGGQYRYH